MGLALITVTLVAIAVAVEVLYVRRNRMIRSIGSMTGSHLVATREASMNGQLGIGPMPVQLLQNAVNNPIVETDSTIALEQLKSMLRYVEEAKRRSFMLPLTTKENAHAIKKWALTTSETGDVARKVLPYIIERQAQQADQMVALSYAEISSSDSRSATQQMRTLTHNLDITNASGISLDPRMALFNPNLANVLNWAEQTEDIQAQATAKGLLMSFEETKRLFTEARNS